MPSSMAPEPLSDPDRRLIAALQHDGRITAERAAAVLGYRTREVHRRLRALTGDGTVRVIGRRPRSRDTGAMLLRIRVLRGKLDTIAAALAARDDVPLIDVSAAGDEISAVLLSGPEPSSRLVFQQLPATNAVTDVSAQTVLHVYADAGDWRLDALTEAERAALTPDFATPAALPPHSARTLDGRDRDIIAALEDDGRLPAAAVAARTGHPESTVRRRLAALFAQRRLTTQVVVDPRRLGMGVDANIWMEVPPDHLDATPTTWTRPGGRSRCTRPCTALWPPPARPTSPWPCGCATRTTSTGSSPGSWPAARSGAPRRW
jgi:DNA-binding Lrp family transcriptional regulator